MSIVELGRLADLLIRRYGHARLSGGSLFEFTSSDVGEEGLEALRIPLRGHPVDHLRRFRPTADCIALGLICGGWAAPMDSPVRPSAHPEAQRIVQSVVLGGDGELVGRLRMPDGSVVDPGRGGVGRIPDAMRGAMRRAA